MMHFFICVTYLIIICSAHPPTPRDSHKTLEKRSLFHDVIESLRIRAQLPENTNENNNIGHFSNRFGFENELLQLPSDSEFVPRRNDRIEMPSLKYRIPKSLTLNEKTENIEDPKDEIVIYVNTPNDDPPISTTQKPKKQKRPKPNTNNKVSNKNNDNETAESDTDTDKPFTNNMAGQSQIGNRESQTVVKPTVIVNFRGSVNHRESEIRVERRQNDNETKTIPQNIFNIKQEIKVEKSDAWMGSSSPNKQPAKVQQDISVIEDQAQQRIEEDMMMCETRWKQNKRDSRKNEILEILVNI